MDFKDCEICGANDWIPTHQGPVRDGAFGNLTGEVIVARCNDCGVERLAEAACKDTDFYEGEKYRQSLEEATDSLGFLREHDIMQQQNMGVFWPRSMRGKNIADIGCGAGSFLDHVSGLAGDIIAVEPCALYHESLSRRGYRVFPLADQAADDVAGTVDFAFSFSVIEHVPDPRGFLQDIARLIKPGGSLLVSTPNRADALMTLGGEAYRQFFYRVAHRWYFDSAAFERCATEAGLVVDSVRYVHRFSLSNAMAFLRDKAPSGARVLPHLDSVLLDDVWKRHLEEKGVSDYLYFFLSRA